MGVTSSLSSVVPETTPLSLKEAFERCRAETEEWAKTFYLGTMLMPLEKRQAIWAIYVWCRRTDEIMDSTEALSKPKEQLLDELDAWELHTRAMFKGHIETWLDKVMVDTIQRYSQPLQPYLDMIEGMRMDLTNLRYKTFSDLQLYCYRVAGTVGLMSEQVMGIDDSYTSAPWSEEAETSGAAVALGIANQLTNILRDVGEDRQRGRIYLPMDEINDFGYSEAELLDGVLNDQWRKLMAFQIHRAREWFKRSESGVRFLAPDARWPVWTSLRLYRGILSRIEDNDYDVFNYRAFVPRYRKLIDLPLSFILSQSK
ncbi:phytoene synthase [Synechococcus sp. CS-197]|uniref:phytoene synthase n=1 Tax=Synechococcus sp. CS-197 TaxID=2847985 RepID=UPI000152539D|nr:phytoene synthase [Synechococcus sp. CS-197]MCT0250158.1 phytoene synthase [Synechococcus sp. CS-197]CAK24695.1 Phytoene synthase [Synechococcus sp. WH 7803]